MNKSKIKQIILVIILMLVTGFVSPLFAQQPLIQKSIKKQTKKEIRLNKQVELERKKLEKQNIKINKSIVGLKKLEKQKAPASLRWKQKREWKQHSEWLKSVIERLSVHQKKSQKLLVDSQKLAKKNANKLQQKDGLDRMDYMNMEMLQLQQSMQMESRQFDMISNILKVRHDAAMAVIRNMK